MVRGDGYEIRVRVHLGRTILTSFTWLHPETIDDRTVLQGRRIDEAALYGLLGQLETLGLELLKVRRLPVVVSCAEAGCGDDKSGGGSGSWHDGHKPSIQGTQTLGAPSRAVAQWS
jgi:hypothetical protein